ncbi:MAG: tRNA dimethylallyltransferase [Oscillibacter sp.]
MRIGLAYEDRDDMKRAIDLRVDKMVEAGLFDEVRALLDSGLPRDVTAMQAIGYKEALAYLDGEAAREEAIDEIKPAPASMPSASSRGCGATPASTGFIGKRGFSPIASLFRQKFSIPMAYPDFNADKPSAKRKERKAMKKSQTFRTYFSSLRAAIARA